MTLLNSILCQADAHYAREDWPAARDSLLVALSVAPDHPQLLGALGNLHYLLQEYTEAATAFAAAVRHQPEDTDLLVRLALCHRELSRFDVVAEVLGEVLRLTPDDSAAQLLLADCHRDTGRTREAAQLYSTLLARHPEHVGVLLALANLLHNTGDRLGAREALQRVLSLEPDNELARENMAAIERGQLTGRRLSAMGFSRHCRLVAGLAEAGPGSTTPATSATSHPPAINPIAAVPPSLRTILPGWHTPPKRRRGPRRRLET
jgi:tetratricopeptide (TPR) repeat protein